MPLDDTQAKWLHRFTLGGVPMPPPKEGEGPTKTESLKEELALKRAKQQIEEQALKAALIAQARKTIDAQKDRIREAFLQKVEVDLNKGKEGKKEKLVEQEMMAPTKSLDEQFEAHEANKLTATPENLANKKEVVKPALKDNPKTNDKGDLIKDVVDVPNKDKKMAMGEAFAIIVTEKDKLKAKKTNRWEIDKKTGGLSLKPQPLFTDDELMDELYTPYIREQIIPDTIVDPRFSRVQKMIDATNKYYMDDCKSKGKQLASGGMALAKGAVLVGTNVAVAVVGAHAPTSTGQEGLAGMSGDLTKQQVAEATAITFGVSAILSAGLDVADMVDDNLKGNQEFPTGKINGVVNMLGVGIGKVVAGATGDSNLGLTITAGICAGATVTAITGTLVTWQQKGGEPPVNAFIEAFGNGISQGFNAASAQEKNTDLSTAYGQTGAAVTMAFNTVAKAAEKNLVAAFKKGDWKAILDVMNTAALEAEKAAPVIAYYASAYNAITGVDPKKEQTPEQIKEKQFQDQQKMLLSQDMVGQNADKFNQALAKLLGEAGKELDGLGAEEKARREKAAKQTFDAKKKELDEAAAKKEQEQIAKQSEQIEKELADANKEYLASLNCLGSTEPSDAEYKSIAKLLAQLERDRAIWDGLTGMLGAGLAIASSVAMVTPIAQQLAPPLKIAGQLVKFCQNLKLAADRLDHFLRWKEAQRDSVSAVSPYATAINNFVSNQKAWATQYSVQAAGNVIQAFLACGELSPYAPAFKLAGAVTGAAFAAEDAVFKFYRQQLLVSAWKETKEALKPANRGNRKLHLKMREINPTLAKYTIAYGALIEQDPVAVAAMNRIGIDRETLTR